MDSDNSLDGDSNQRSVGYRSSDDENDPGPADSKFPKVPHSPLESPPDSPIQDFPQKSQRRSSSGSPSDKLSPPSSPLRSSASKSPSSGSHGRESSPDRIERECSLGSPSRQAPPARSFRRTPSGSPPKCLSRRTPLGSPSPHTPSRSPSPFDGDPRRTPSGSPRRTPQRRSMSQSPGKLNTHGSPRSPAAHISLGSPKRCSPSSSPVQAAPSGGRRTPSGSPTRRSPLSSPIMRKSPHYGRSSGSPTGSRHSDRGSYSRRAHGKKSKRRNGGHISDGSDDGRSNISSSSSFGGAPESPKAPARLENGNPKEHLKFEPHKAEDLSDVSDLDSAAGDGSLDSVSDEEGSRKKRMKDEVKKSASPVRITQPTSIRKDIVSHSDEMEQLDFEAEEPQSKEDKDDGECGEIARRPESSVKSEGDDGELKNDEVEEGEITDEDENRPEETEPRPICRFYNRGQCTWGSSCRFLHPGVTDKGNYTMFDMVRPLVPTNGPMYGSMIDYRAPMERPMMAPVGPLYTSRKEETPALESAWERGLRTAKEMMRKASKRKETDMDFEEKKMNLSLGQDELDKENDYYTRPASPAIEDELDRWR